MKTVCIESPLAGDFDNPRFDLEGLVAAVFAKQERLGLRQCVAAEAVGVSKASMSRLLNGDLSPGLAMVVKLTDWLDVPFDRFVKRPNRGRSGKRSDILARIEALLLADKSLHVSTAAALSRIIRVAYREMQRSQVG